MQKNEDEEIYWSIHDAIVIERKGGKPLPIDIAALYQEFKEKYFKDSVPELSKDFVCTFIKLPFDIGGISYFSDEDVIKLGVKKGIRINEKFKEFPAEAKVALMHEMIHATGIRKHGPDFKLALADLFNKGAYLEPLIL